MLKDVYHAHLAASTLNPWATFLLQSLLVQQVHNKDVFAINIILTHFKTCILHVLEP